MKVEYSNPPNILAIWSRFPVVRGRRGVMFCYGDTIYSPSGIEPPPEIVVHETIHSERQGDDPAGWWERYLADDEFRFREEALAYKAQYDYVCIGASRQVRRASLRAIAKALASPIYGRLITEAQARELLA